MFVSDLMLALLSVAEKGANIARIIRSEESLLELLIQEKTGENKNERFGQDFKTLADVLIQEMVRHDLGKKFPGIKGSIYGEESNKFTNVLGETVVVEPQGSVEETRDLLCNILNGDDTAAAVLSEAVHADVTVAVDPDIQQLTQNIPLSDIGIWIDPIDSTAQYIHGQVGSASKCGIVAEGLQCVVILIGMFDKTSGLPICGIAVQPFSSYNDQNKVWHKQVSWGICYKDIKLSSVTSSLLSPLSPSSSSHGSPSVIMSASEADDVRKRLSEHFTLRYAAGAGYKLLCTAKGLVDAYVLSKRTIYKWDCCAPHAILLAIGGGIVPYQQAIENSRDSSHNLQVKYHFTSSPNDVVVGSSIDGVIAYRSEEHLKEILKHLS